MNTDHQNYVATVRNAAETLVESAAKLETHALALDALMAAYVAIAQTHACCTFSAGLKARRCGMALIENSANQATHH